MKDFNASNDPDTCLWCGDKLRHSYETTWQDRDDWTEPVYCPGCPKEDPYDQPKGGPWVPLDPEPGWFLCQTCGEHCHGHNPRRTCEKRVRTSRHPGYDQEGCFCSLRCGYQFGLTLALGGRRLRAANEEESDG